MENKKSFWDKNTVIALSLTAAAFIFLRFYLPQYPAEFSGDEMNEIREAAYRHLGIFDLFRTDRQSIGAYGSVFFQFSSLFVPLIRENLYLYRTLAASLSLLTLLGIFLFAKTMFGRTTALFAVFISGISFWSFFNSRLFLTNPFCALMTVYTLYFLAQALIKGPKWIAPWILSFLICADTYVNWLTMVPLTAFMIFVFWRQGLIKGRYAGALAAAAAALTTAMAIYHFDRTGMFGRAAVVMKESGSFNPANMALSLLNIFDLFVTGNDQVNWYLVYRPFLNPAETALAIYGFIILLRGINRLPEQTLLAMLACFVAPLFLQLHIHQIRIVQAPVAFSIMAAVGLRRLYFENKKAFAAAVLALVAAAAFYQYEFFTGWEKGLYRDSVNIRMADYLNREFKSPVYLKNFEYNYLEEPDRTFLRLKSTYRKGEVPTHLAFKINGLWIKDVAKYFEGSGADLHVFESTVEGGFKRFPYLLVTVPEGPASSRFIDYDARLEEILRASRTSRESALRLIDGSYTANNDSMLFYTILKDIQANIFLASGEYGMAAETYLSRINPSWQTPDVCLKLSRIYEAMGDKEKARMYGDIFREKMSAF